MFHDVGTLKNLETREPILTHIEMNSDVKPVIQPPRPVPHHLEEKTKKKYGKDPRISRFLGVASDLSFLGDLILFKDKVVPPHSERRRFVEKAHKMGHSGETRTLNLLQVKIWFPGISKVCKDTVQNCQSFQVTYDRTYDEAFKSTPLPPGPWHIISVDFKGPLKDVTYALVGYDLYSRYPVVGYC